MEKVKLSVVVLSYNHEKTIKQCLNSILSQKVDCNFEILVGEDCSPDNSKMIFSEYEKKHPEIIKIFYREKNIGAVKNYLDLLFKCKGEYIAFIETDDYWTDNYFIKTAIEFLEKNIIYSGVYSKVNKIDKESTIIGILPNEKSRMNEYENIEQILFDKYEIPSFSLIFRNYYKEYNKNEIYRLYSGSNWIGDYVNSFLLLQRGKIGFINKIIGNYRFILSGTTSFSSKNYIEKTKETIKVNEKIREYLGYKYNEKFKYKIAIYELKIIKEYLKIKDVKGILNYLIKERKSKVVNLLKTILLKVIRKEVK